MSKSPAIFLDTSIQIARVVHSQETKARIESRVKQYEITVSSEVVKQEFKRRLLKEAQYLLNQLDRLGSLQKVNRHVESYLPQQQNRKRNICLEVIATLWEGAADRDLTERAKRTLTCLIKFGLDELEDSTGSIVREAGCACSRLPIVERKARSQYDFGKEKCSKMGDSCRLKQFLESRKAEVEALLAAIIAMPEREKTRELHAIRKFIENFLANPDDVTTFDPCLTVGDLPHCPGKRGHPGILHAECQGEQALMPRLDQDMVVRPKNPVHEDMVCPKSEPDSGSDP